MSKDTYAALDLETTGLSAKQDRIIEIGAVLVENDEIRDMFSTFVNPRCQLTERIVKITGISQEDVDNAPEIGEILTPLSEFIGDRVLLGHRILFDYSFLKRAFVNAGMTFEKCGIDTLKLARICLPQLPSKKLSDLCVYYGISQRAHRALEDAKAAHFLYQRLKAEFQKEGSEPETVFRPQKLIYKVKKEATASKKQKERLLSLIGKHKLIMTTDVDSMSKNEISRLTDQILAKYGR